MIQGFLGFLIYVAMVVSFYKIFERTGHSGLWGLIAIIPGAQPFLVIWLAFKSWPVEGGRP